MGKITRAANHLKLEQVKEKMKECKDTKQLKRWQIVYATLLQPRKAEDIAICIGVSKSLVQKIISRYNREGVEAIEIKSCGGRYHEYLSIEEEKNFLAPFWKLAEQGEITTTEELHRAYEEQVGHPVHETTIYRLLERHNWRKLLPRSIHPKADIEAQEAFKKKLPQSIEEALQDRKPDDHRPVIFMVQDEARFGRITQPRRCWAPKGMRPCTPHQIVREAIYAFTAVAPQYGKMTSLILPTANTDMMELFLEHISKEFTGSFLVMQVDGASWHRSQQLHVPENIRLIFQPPYSPQVNPVEHIWDELREKNFHNRIFPSLDALQDHLCTALNKLSSNTGIIRSLTYFPHIYLACEKAG